MVQYKQLGQNLDRSYVYVCDEYFAKLQTETLDFRKDSIISPLLLMGHTYKAFLSTGHNSSGYT